MDAQDVLYEIASTFYGSNHEDWLRKDDDELRLGNLVVKADGEMLTWRDLGLPRNAGSSEIPYGSDWDEELPDGSYIEDIVDEVGQWLLGWADDVDTDDLLRQLQDTIGGEIAEGTTGDQVLVNDDGVTAWSMASWDEVPWVTLQRGSVVGETDDERVDVLWEDSYPIDPELVVTGYVVHAVEEAYRELCARR